MVVGSSERIALQCKKPFVRSGLLPFGCGRCTPCKVSKARAKAARLQLEFLSIGGVGLSSTHTYAPAFVPPLIDPETGEILSGGNLRRRDVQLLAKRVRKAAEAAGAPRFRVVGVGEYGRETFRPHYHLQWIGLDWRWHELVRDAWRDSLTGQSMGHVDCKPMDSGSIGYWRDHMVSCWTQRSDARLSGREPEFFIWPTRPGLGVPAVPAIAETLRDRHGQALIEREGDVPGVVLQGGKPLVLDRLMRGHLRKAVMSEERAAELQARRGADFVARCLAGQAQAGAVVWRLCSPFVDAQRMLQGEVRRKIFRKRASV